MILKFTLIFLVFIWGAHGSDDDQFSVVGKIVGIKGQATVINGEGHDPIPVKFGDKVLNDSSYYCPSDCYVTVKLFNNLSYFKLGQRSQASIRVDSNQRVYTLKLLTGYVKTLFKESDYFQKMIIQTGNAKVEVNNNKILTIYSHLINRTSVINYKGGALFSHKTHSDGAITLDKLQYSYINKRMLAPSEAEILPERRYNYLLKVFNIAKEKPGESTPELEELPPRRAY